MARNKEALVLLLDVSPSMHSVLPDVEKICLLLLQKKLVYNKNDEVGVIVFGTEDTCNELEKEVGGYEHVVVLKTIKVVDDDALEVLQKLPRGATSGDFLDAIVVGMDMLIKKFGPTNKGKQRLCLITGAQYPIKEPYEGTKADQIDTISTQMKAHGMRLDCIVVRDRQAGTANRRTLEENDLLLQRFSKKACARTVFVESSTSLLGALRTRNILPVTIFRGEIEISPRMSIKVWVYKKVSEERLPVLKKFSDKAPSSDKLATHEVKMDFEYKRAEDPTKIVPPEQRIKGFRYGPQVVPISSTELELLKFKPEKGVKLLGFTNSSNIKRHYYMKEVYVFIPEPGNRKAMLAVSALARAMEETKRVAILRCVWKQGQANVVIGVLTPNISASPNLPDSFYFNILPFVEDVREFRFPSFSNLPPSKQPNEKQQEAADNLVRMLDLAPPTKEEKLCPDLTLNPTLMRFYNFLELKSRQPDADVPSMDQSLKQIVEPDSCFISKNNSVVADFVKQFELKDNPKIKKSSKRLFKDKPSTSNEDIRQDEDNVSDVQSVISFENSSMGKIVKIGNATPVQDFQAMLSRRDGQECVTDAIEGMKKVITGFIENGLNSDTCQKAIECLVALRSGCVIEQEPNEFNHFMHHLAGRFRGESFNCFWELLVLKNISLITKREAIDSEVPDDKAHAFLIKDEAVS
ncbi:ATP-dependent DNA helicase 2 subunit KU80 [Nymphaea colorata]|nr:ATP-dependent DNA helicase 2 subunit KU80 [Nymphaea colorata]